MSEINYPPNQRTIRTNSSPTNNPLKAGSPRIPGARVSSKFIDSGTIEDGFRRVGNDIVKQQLPNFIGRLLHSLVDALLGQTTPYISRTNSYGYNPYPQTGRYVNPYQQKPIEVRNTLSGVQPPMAQRRSFDSFILPDKESAHTLFDNVISETEQKGYITVSQVYDYLRLPCSYMGVQYYWTADDLSLVELTESPQGIRVRFPKARIIE